jgi:3-methylfumaryl-CoA hydratase
MNETPRPGVADDAVGRSRTASERIDVVRARALAATLDLEPEDIQPGDPLPLGWHWIYFNPTARRSDLGEDGHERRGTFLPAIDLPRRMWAGGRLRFLAATELGVTVQRTSTVRSVVHKVGRSGPLAFVSVEHRIHQGDRTLVEERQDLVYLGDRPTATEPSATAPTAEVDAGKPRWSERCTVDEVTLFRFSALTFNGHRIHYDAPYATGVEGYPGLVVHGPLLALLLLDAGLRRDGTGSGKIPEMPVTFEYRARQPIFCREPFALQGMTRGTAEGGTSSADTRFDLRAAHRERGTSMTASLGFG